MFCAVLWDPVDLGNKVYYGLSAKGKQGGIMLRQHFRKHKVFFILLPSYEFMWLIFDKS